MSKLAVVLIAGVAVLACRGPQIPPPPSTTPETLPAIVLPEPSKTPRYSITTNDPDEIALLTQQLKLTGVTATPGAVYFEADAGQLGRLRELGYQVTQADAEAVDYRIVRVRRRGTEEELRAQGITIISREKTYWIISAKLGQLRRLVADGYLLQPIAPDEPRPRLVRIVVTSQDDVQRVANYQIDIFTVADSAGRFTIDGAALDMQIDRLRAAGFTVVQLP
jgi:hypothetical protein